MVFLLRAFLKPEQIARLDEQAVNRFPRKLHAGCTQPRAHFRLV